MRPADLWRQAWTALRADPLQSALLSLSVALGVAMLALVLSLRGGSEAMTDNLLGSYRFRELNVVAQENDWGSLDRGGASPSAVRVTSEGQEPVRFVPDDLEALRREAPAVQAAYLREYSFLRGSQRSLTDSWTALAISPDFLKVADLKIVAGRGLDAADIAQKRAVLLITERVARTRFPQGNAVGQVVDGFTIVGVFRPAEETQFTESGGVDGLVPYGVRQNTRYVRQLTFLAAAGQDAEAREQLRTAAARRWGEGAVVTSPSDGYAQARAQWLRSRATLGVLGAAGLLTAGLSVLGLVTWRVAARRRLVAIAGAVGASALGRFTQVLAEVALPAGLGAALGVGIAWGLITRLSIPDISLGLPRVQLSLSVLLLTALGGWLLALLFALPPASEAARFRLGEVLRE